MTEPEPREPLHPRREEEGRPQAASPQPARKGGFWRFVWQHPALVTLVLILLVLMIFIGQNMEATAVDFLFWEAIVVPKILLLFVGVPLGALGWELVRRAFR